MYAIVETGAKQYWVSPGDLIKVEKLDFEAGTEAVLSNVLLIADETLHLGTPYLTKAGIVCDVLETDRHPKITIFKFKRRKGYRLKKGHRQSYTLLKIKEIKLDAPKKKSETEKKASKS